jgi:hypothetical protein
MRRGKEAIGGLLGDKPGSIRHLAGSIPDRGRMDPGSRPDHLRSWYGAVHYFLIRSLPCCGMGPKIVIIATFAF